jgi:hypothetical protein
VSLSDLDTGGLHARLLEQLKGSMCNYIVNLTDAQEVDAELVAWIKSAYEGAG